MSRGWVWGALAAALAGACRLAAAGLNLPRLRPPSSGLVASSSWALLAEEVDQGLKPRLALPRLLFRLRLGSGWLQIGLLLPLLLLGRCLRIELLLNRLWGRLCALEQLHRRQ